NKSAYPVKLSCRKLVVPPPVSTMRLCEIRSFSVPKQSLFRDTPLLATQPRRVRCGRETINYSGCGQRTVRNKIVQYDGETVDKHCIDKRYPGEMTASYAECVGKNRCIDSACSRGLGSLANAMFTSSGKVSHITFHNSLSSLQTATRRRPDMATRQKTHRCRGRHFHHYGNDYRLEHNHSTRHRQTVADTRPC
ncbi:unnamed protein product, partial [Pylaiella littoralis]